MQTYFPRFVSKVSGLFRVACLFFVVPALFPWIAGAQETKDVFSLQETIAMALDANLGLKISKEETAAATYTKRAAKTGFYPTFSTAYQYQHLDEENRSDLYGLLEPQDTYYLVATVSQPLFAGFSIINGYKLATLGLDVAKIEEKLTRREIIFNAKNAYFTLLKAQKLVTIAEEAVTMLEAHREVADNFYQVGMTPLNDLLKAEVELANARQDLIVARNTLDIAKSNFNTLLRRHINGDVELKDILDYTPFEMDIDDCLENSENNRLEITVADKGIEAAEKEIDLEKKDFYPTVSLEGNYYRAGDQWNVDGGEGIDDSSWWDIQATASWSFWEWGRTSYGVKEKLRRLSQAKYGREEVGDIVRLEVKKAYLNTMESEQNIITVRKAIEQAKENFRINEERYKEQMATSTDVLDARTLLSQTMTNYYNALYDFKIAKASLYKAMGQEIME
jgi:outer membrane protein